MEQERSDTNVKRRVGYVCPECYMIFRMEMGNGGRRAQCPGCHALVILGGKVLMSPPAEPEGGAGRVERGGVSPPPAEPEPEGPKVELEAVGRFPVQGEPAVSDGEGTGGGGAAKTDPTELAPEREEVLLEAEGARSGERRRKKVRRRKGKPEEPAWEKQVRKKKVRRMGWVTPVLVVLCLMGVGAGVAYWAHSIVGLGSDPLEVRGGGLSAEEPGLPEVGVDTEVGVEDLAVVVEAFLGAETVGDLLETVRDRKRLEPGIRRHYGDGYVPAQVREIAPDDQIQTTGELYAVVVELSDFSRKPIALARSEDGFLVDWESWVGYSEMGWDAFMRDRPTAPVLFRVKTQQLDYYNFDFTDDKTWQSFRLESPDGVHTLYAYVPRYSRMVQQLKPLDPTVGTGTHTLRLRYAEGASRPDQVLIEEVIASGWVVTDRDKSKF